MARSKVDWTDSPAAVPTLRRSDSLGECRKRKSRIYTNMEWALMTLIMNLKRRVFFYLLHIKVHNKQANPNSIHSLRIHSVVVFPLLWFPHFTCSEESKAISGRPDSPSHKQSNAGSKRRSARPCTRTGRRPIAAQCPLPGRRRRCVRPWEASRSTASEERRLLRRYLLRVSQGAGCPHSGACRLFALPSEPGSRGIEGKRSRQTEFTALILVVQAVKINKGVI